MDESLSCDIFCDFTCPWVYQAAVWLRMVKAVKGIALDINWRYFSLEQANSKEGPDWKVWEQPFSYVSRGLPAFKAAEAARLQGRDAYDRMHWALLEGRNERRIDFADPEQLEETARCAGLDLRKFRKDLSDPSFMKKLAGDHTLAVQEYGIFGTPTFAFPGTKPFFMRMTAPQSQEEALRMYDSLTWLFAQRGNIDEVKRPRKPRQ